MSMIMVIKLCRHLSDHFVSIMSIRSPSHATISSKPMATTVSSLSSHWSVSRCSCTSNRRRNFDRGMQCMGSYSLSASWSRSPIRSTSGLTRMASCRGSLSGCRSVTSFCLVSTIAYTTWPRMRHTFASRRDGVTTPLS